MLLCSTFLAKKKKKTTSKVPVDFALQEISEQKIARVYIENIMYYCVIEILYWSLAQN